MIQFQHLYERPGSMAGVSVGYFDPRSPLPGNLERNRLALMDAYAEAYQECRGVKPDLAKLPVETQRLIIALAENQDAMNRRASGMGHANALFRTDEAAAQQTGLRESTTTSDIAAFTTQQIAFVVDVFAPYLLPRLATTVAMLGPTAFWHERQFTRANASQFYDAGDPLVDGLDPSYSECPTECEAANGVDLEVSANLIEADCDRLAATYCIPANWHYSSQYRGDLGAALMEGMTEELQRNVQAQWVNALVANAGATTTWNQTPDPLSYYATARPTEWVQDGLGGAIKEANRNILKAPGGRVSASRLIGDVDALGILEDANPIEFVDQQPANVIDGRVDDASFFLGRTKVGRYDTFRLLEGMPTDTLVLYDPSIALFCPWIPITSLGMLQDPELAQVKMGAITLWGRAFLRPDRIQEISIGA